MRYPMGMRISWILPGLGIDESIPVWRVVPADEVLAYMEALSMLGFSPTAELV